MDWSGGGRASNRETTGRVLAGAIAFKVLKRLCPKLETSCYVRQVGKVGMDLPVEVYAHEKIYNDSNPIRCPDKVRAKQMLLEINAAKAAGDSVGAIVEFAVRGVPIGLGDPVFEKITAELARALMSLPASRGVEIGVGFRASSLRGSEHNDIFENISGQIRTRTNHAGGVLGGISNGDLLYGRVAFKPPSTIGKPQASVDVAGAPVEISGKEGRHDPCVASRAVPVVECMIACVLLDRLLANYAVQSVLNNLQKFNLHYPALPVKKEDRR
jgi:chorismate synthase